MEGTIPKHNREYEESILGSILLVKDEVHRVSDILQADDFFVDEHRIIYKKAMEMLADSKPINAMTMIQELKNSKELEFVGGAYGVSSLTSRVTSGANLEYFAISMKEMAMDRRLLAALHLAYNNVLRNSSKTIHQMIESVYSSLDEATNDNITMGDVQHISTAWNKKLEEMQAEIKPSGIMIGWKDYDRATGGYKDGNFYIVAARPSVGKTAFVINMIRNMAKQGKKIGFWQLEMSSEQLIERFMSIESQVHYKSIQNNKLSEEEWKKMLQAGSLASEGIYINTNPDLSNVTLSSQATKLNSKEGIDCIVVDYIQLMDGVGANINSKEQEVAKISREAKKLAKRLNVPVIFLAQLSRKCEERVDKTPLLSDLRDSGGIEQDADGVTMLFRPALYSDHPEAEVDGISYDSKELLIAYIRKNRGGELGKFPLKFDMPKQLITDFPIDVEIYRPNGGF